MTRTAEGSGGATAAYQDAVRDLHEQALRLGVDVGPALDGARQLRREVEHRDFTGYSTTPTLRLIEAWRLRGRQRLARARWLLDDDRERGRR